MGVDTWTSVPSMTEGAGWKSEPAASAGDGWEGSVFDDSEAPFTGEISAENISKHAATDGGCRVCGEDGHFARDCPDKKENSGECYNCGEHGHNKADCPNPPVERPFTGECKSCGQEGHRARDCLEKPMLCRFCGGAGHVAANCEANRMFAKMNVEGMTAEEAWKQLEEADKLKEEVEDIRKALLAYAYLVPGTTFEELEHAFRDGEMNTFLIAKEQDISDTHTIVNLQGKIDQKYAIAIQFTDKPRRKMFATGWPSSREENLQRLTQAGFVMDRGVPKCANCNQMGHATRQCPEEMVVKSIVPITCTNCHENGHRNRDCPEPRRSGKECRHCGETGHIAKECPTKEPDVCRNCGEEGHRAKECEKERVMKCRNCDGEGHAARECPEPKNMAKVQCRNCDEMGHVSRECPKPTDWSRVECSNCHEKGHSYKRCPNPAAPADDDNGEDDWNASTSAAAPSGGGKDGTWQSGEASSGASVGASGGWAGSNEQAAPGTGGW